MRRYRRQRFQAGFGAFIFGLVVTIWGIALPGPMLGATASAWALPAVLLGVPVLIVGLLMLLRGMLPG